MFRTKRTHWVSLGLVLGVLLLPLPAAAGGLWDRVPTEGFWADVLAWLGLGPVWIETTSPYVDPNGGQSGSSGSGSENGETSPYIDPLGQPGSSVPSTEEGETSPMVDPNGQP